MRIVHIDNYEVCEEKRTGYLNKQTKETLLCYIQEREKYVLQKNIMTDTLFITERKCRITPGTIQRDLKSLYKKAEIDENKYSVIINMIPKNKDIRAV